MISFRSTWCEAVIVAGLASCGGSNPTMCGDACPGGHDDGGADGDTSGPHGVLDQTFGTGGLTTSLPSSFGGAANALLFEPATGFVLGAGDGLSSQGKDSAFSYLDPMGKGFAGNDGSWTFSVGGTQGPDSANAVIQQADHQIVAVGFWANSNDQQFAVSRWNVDARGTLDTTFNSVGYNVFDMGDTMDAAFAVVEQTSGNLVVGGIGNDGTGKRAVMCRVTSAGALDTAFGTQGKTYTSFNSSNIRITGVFDLAGGKLLAVGESIDYQAVAIARYSADGVLDPTFGGGSGVVHSGVKGRMFRDPTSGKFYASDAFSSTAITLTRIDDTDGSIDTTWATNGVATIPVPGGQNPGNPFAGLAVQADHKIVLVSESADNRFIVLRVNPDGTPDTLFGTNGMVKLDFSALSTNPGGKGSAVVIQPDKKIVVLGAVDFSTGTPLRFGYARLLP